MNWTAYSQITGIQKETKQEIVTTLLAYPIALQEIETLVALNSDLNEIIKQYESKASIYEEIFRNQQLEIDNLEQQKLLYKKELNRKKSHLYVFVNVPINSVEPEVLLLYSIKESLLIGTGAQYNSFTKSADLKVGLGIKIF